MLLKILFYFSSIKCLSTYYYSPLIEMNKIVSAFVWRKKDDCHPHQKFPSLDCDIDRCWGNLPLIAISLGGSVLIKIYQLINGDSNWITRREAKKHKARKWRSNSFLLLNLKKFMERQLRGGWEAYESPSRSAEVIIVFDGGAGVRMQDL